MTHLKNTSTKRQTVKKNTHTQNKTMGYMTPAMG